MASILPFRDFLPFSSLFFILVSCSPLHHLPIQFKPAKRRRRKMNFPILLLLSFLSISNIGESKRTERTFEGYSVLRLHPETKDQLKALHDLQLLTDSDRKFRSKVDFWKAPRSLNSSVDLMIAPDLKKDILDTLSARGIKGRVMIPNLQSFVYHITSRFFLPFSSLSLLPRGKKWSCWRTVIRIHATNQINSFSAPVSVAECVVERRRELKMKLQLGIKSN